MPSSTESSSARAHPISTIIGWLFAAIALLLTALALVMAVNIASGLSDYEGGESGVALAIVGVTTLVALVSWGIAWLAFSSRGDAPRPNQAAGGIVMALVAAAMFVFLDDVVVAVPITLLIVGIALIGNDARARSH